MLAVYLSEAFLYLCFSLLLGGLLSYLIPDSFQPRIIVPKKLMYFCVIGISVFSFFPVVRIMTYFASDIGILLTFKSVMTTFEEGKAYLWTLALCLLLFFTMISNDIRKQLQLSIFCFLLVFAMIIALGFSSHVYSLTEGIWGGALHSIHFFAVCLWTGLLFVSGWFSKDHSRWLVFLRWYTPLSISCVLITVVTGLVIMQYMVPQYINSWILSYGQALLVKHLLIIPLIVYALINGFLIRKRIRTRTSEYIASWVKAESIIVFLIFLVTGFMGQQSPPHDVSLTLLENKPSMFFNAFNNSDTINLPLTVSVNSSSILLSILALFLLLLVIYTFIKKQKFFLSFIYSGLFVAAAYISLMIAMN